MAPTSRVLSIKPIATLWALRLGVLALPLSAVAYPFQPAAEAFGWTVWAILVFVAFYRHPVGLVVIRALPPAGVLVSVGASQWSAAVLLLAITTISFTNAVGTAMVNGPAYPNEHRELLRPPSGVMFGPLQLAWLAFVGPIVGIGLALQSEQLGLALGCTVLAAALGPLALRSMHALARRWLVFVPAGVVLHDPMVLSDPVLLQRELIERLEPAPIDTDALDLTFGSWGLALQLSLHERVPMVLRADLESGSSARFLVTPSRAGAVLASARQCKIGKIRITAPT